MISVIVPIYKVEQYLRQCLDSLEAQTADNIEFILVDDGSPDNCPKICDEYAERDGRFKVVHRENGGLLSARKAGLRASVGDYIGFVDGDDWVESDTFANMQHALDEYSPDMVISEFLCDFGDRVEPSKQSFKEGLYDRSRMEAELFPTMLFDGHFYCFGINPNCWSKLVKRELIEKNLYPVDERIRMGEDAAFIYPCLLDAQSVACIKTPTYHYRITGQSMSTAYDEKLKDIILLPYEQLKSKNSTASFDISSQLDYYLIYMTNFLIRNEAKKANAHTKKERKEILRTLVSNGDIINAASAVEMSRLPLHTKLLTQALKHKSVFLTARYVDFLRMYLKG